jgi:arsenate reductase
MANLLFVCAGNSVRSQMAEGWARRLGDGLVDARSAGLQPAPVHPLAVAVMKEVGIDISGHRNRRLDERLLEWADYVITLSDMVKSYSIYFPKDINYDHWSIPNPDSLVNDEISHDDAYARVRDDIKLRVEKLLANIGRK